MSRIAFMAEHPSAQIDAAGRDLRGFIDLLDRKGKLRRVTAAVDWKYELGDLTRANQTPLLFENVKGYPGHRVFTNGLANFAAIALALGVDSGWKRKEVLRSLRKRIADPIAPRVVETGPVIENVMRSSEIDFLKLPVPHWSREENGRYIGTWHLNVTAHPETQVRNLGIYRMQVLSRNRATVSTSHNSHLAMHFAKAEERGEGLPMAVAIGVNETVIMAAAAGWPYGLDEYELAGSLAGEPVPLIGCKTANLQVPANAEIVIEGFLLPGKRAVDGPYFDYAGTPNTNPNAYVFEATQMMFRDNPIFRGAAIGRPGAEDQQLFSVLSELELFDFHGSRARHAVQNSLLKKRLFRAFQFAGRI